jgi:hypothetical protein
MDLKLCRDRVVTVFGRPAVMGTHDRRVIQGERKDSGLPKRRLSHRDHFGMVIDLPGLGCMLTSDMSRSEEGIPLNPQLGGSSPSNDFCTIRNSLLKVNDEHTQTHPSSA